MYFEKSVTSKYCTLETSAMSWNMKRAILSQEVIQRLLNTSEEIDHHLKDMILKNLAERLKRSWYRARQIREIISSGLKGYRNKWGAGQVRHRSSKRTEGARKIKKLI